MTHYKRSTGLDRQEDTWETPCHHRCHHHDVYRHASLGATAQAFCVNYSLLE